MYIPGIVNQMHQPLYVKPRLTQSEWGEKILCVIMYNMRVSFRFFLSFLFQQRLLLVLRYTCLSRITAKDERIIQKEKKEIMKRKENHFQFYSISDITTFHNNNIQHEH